MQQDGKKNETICWMDQNGELSASCPHDIEDAILVKGYKTAVLTRHIDRQMIILQRQGTISFAMSCLGEEISAIASAAALKDDDWIYPQYREYGAIFWRGFSAKQYVHHMFCDANDIIFGRQMPNHFGSRKLNVVHVSSPIGTKIPHAAGAAYAMKIQEEKNVVLCYFGEGATSEGDFHVGLNFAAVRKAPVIFFCRNNGFAISTPCQEQFACDGIASKGSGYGIHSIKVDGNDFFAVYGAVSDARKWCLDGKGPVLIEAMTYRVGAHSTSDDPSLYRDDEEVKKWQDKDPIARLRLYLEKKGLWDSVKQQELEKEVNQQIEEAITEAKVTPKPNTHSLIENVYFDIPRSLAAQYNQWVKTP